MFSMFCRWKCWSKDEKWNFITRIDLFGKVLGIEEYLNKELSGKKYNLKWYGRSKESRVYGYEKSVYLCL